MQLISHPATPMLQVDSLDVVLSPDSEGGLLLRFDCRCRAGALRLPQARPSGAADELWRHTCCELFAGVAGDAAYTEFNWSPSGEWAMYPFSDYRRRDSSAPAKAAPAPHVEFACDGEGWMLDARLAAAALPAAASGQIELGLAAVLEAADGSLSYWALRHAAAQPDFHLREAFVLRLGELSAEVGQRA